MVCSYQEFRLVPLYKSLFHHTMVDKNEKYRKTNLTNDRKTQIREHIHDTFIDVQIYFNLSMNFFDRC